MAQVAPGFAAGFGVGLVLVFTLSALGLFTPGAGRWLVLLVVCTGVGFAIGFLTPAPNEDEPDDEYEDDVLVAQIVIVDEDPLEGGQVRSGSPASPLDIRVTPTPDIRMTVPADRLMASNPPVVADGRSTAAPDSRATAPPTVQPDDRGTVVQAAPDARGTVVQPAPDATPMIGAP